MSHADDLPSAKKALDWRRPPVASGESTSGISRGVLGVSETLDPLSKQYAFLQRDSRLSFAAAPGGGRLGRALEAEGEG